MLPAAPSVAAPLAGENGCVRDVADPGQPMPDEKPSKAVPTLLRLDEAHRVSRGQGVGVAVIDSGVDTGTGALDVRGGLSVGGARGGRPEDAHGTIVAGLVAGDDQKRGIVGIAPDAHVVPIRVLDGDSEVVDEGLRLEAGNLAAGIREAIKLRNSQNIRVINLSLVLDAPSRAVADAIAAAQKAGILVVSAVGNRPPDETGTGPADPYKVGEKQVRFPATEKGVLGVTALDAGGDLDPTFVWTGPGTDVSAPAVKALSVTVGGAACGIVDVASSWATAQVSGLAALLFAEDETLTPGPGQHPDRGHRARRDQRQRPRRPRHDPAAGGPHRRPRDRQGRDAAPRAGVHRPAHRGEGSRAAAGHLRGVPADDAVVGDRCRWGAAARPAAAAADRAPAYLSLESRVR